MFRNTLRQAKKIILGYQQVRPALVILGAQKGGTTALHKYLGMHPQISVPLNKELNYFNSISRDDASVDDYLALFPKVYGRYRTSISIDASPNYALDCHHCVATAESLKLDLRYLVSLREPVDRAISAWFMYKGMQQDAPQWFLAQSWVEYFQSTGTKLVRRSPNFGNDFARDIEEELGVLDKGNRIEFPIVEYGHYMDQLQQLYALVDPSRVMLINNRDLKQNTQDCLNLVCDFLGLKRHTFASHDLAPQFVGKNKRALPEHSLDVLRSYYADKNQGLINFLPSIKNWDQVV